MKHPRWIRVVFTSSWLPHPRSRRDRPFLRHATSNSSDKTEISQPRDWLASHIRFVGCRLLPCCERRGEREVKERRTTRLNRKMQNALLGRCPCESSVRPWHYPTFGRSVSAPSALTAFIPRLVASSAKVKKKGWPMRPPQNVMHAEPPTILSRLSPQDGSRKPITVWLRVTIQHRHQ